MPADPIQPAELVRIIAEAIDNHTEAKHGYVLGSPERDALAADIALAVAHATDRTRFGGNVRERTDD